MPRPPRLKGPSAPTTYTDSEEALEAGVEHEERGERLAYGVKARRAYESALDLYELARRLSPQADADATYNAARVLYVLASCFYMPGGAKEEAFQRSITLYRHAAERNEKEDFALDIASNLAVAIQGYVEFCVDSGGDKEAVVSLTQEALGLLERVANEHEVVLRAQLEDELRDSGGGSEAAPVEEASTEAPMDSSDPSASTSTSQYSSSLIVPSSLLDAYLTSISLLTNLCSIATHTDLNTIEAQLTAYLEKAQSFVAQCNAANDWGQRASPDDDWERAVSELAKSTAEARLTVVGALFDRRVSDGGIQAAAVEYVQQVTTLGSEYHALVQVLAARKEVLAQQSATLPESRRKAFWQIKVDEMISSASAAVELSRILLRIAASDPTSSTPPLRLSWSLASATSQLYTLIISLLDTTSTSSAAVLGSAQTANATTLLRCQVLTSLADVCILRSNELYTQLAGPAVVNAKSRATIVDNARVYAKRALTDVGLGWVTTISSEKEAQGIMRAVAQPQVSAAHKPIVAAKRDIPPGGWDAIQTQGEAILTYVRAVFTRAALYPRIAAEKAADIQATAQGELASVALACNVLVTPASNDEHDNAIARAWTMALDTNRWLESLADEEGQEMISADEITFWQNQWRGSL